MARATPSSLKDHRSSMLPPPRHSMVASQPLALACPRASAIRLAAPSPWTRVGKMLSAQMRCPPVQRGQHVAQGGGLQAADDGDVAREFR